MTADLFTATVDAARAHAGQHADRDYTDVPSRGELAAMDAQAERARAAKCDDIRDLPGNGFQGCRLSRGHTGEHDPGLVLPGDPVNLSRGGAA